MNYPERPDGHFLKLVRVFANSHLRSIQSRKKTFTRLMKMAPDLSQDAFFCDFSTYFSAGFLSLSQTTLITGSDWHEVLVTLPAGQYHLFFMTRYRENQAEDLHYSAAVADITIKKKKCQNLRGKHRKTDPRTVPFLWTSASWMLLIGCY